MICVPNMFENIRSYVNGWITCCLDHCYDTIKNEFEHFIRRFAYFVTIVAITAGPTDHRIRNHLGMRLRSCSGLKLYQYS